MLPFFFVDDIYIGFLAPLGIKFEANLGLFAATNRCFIHFDMTGSTGAIPKNLILPTRLHLALLSVYFCSFRYLINDCPLRQ